LPWLFFFCGCVAAAGSVDVVKGEFRARVSAPPIAEFRLACSRLLAEGPATPDDFPQEGLVLFSSTGRRPERWPIAAANGANAALEQLDAGASPRGVLAMLAERRFALAIEQQERVSLIDADPWELGLFGRSRSADRRGPRICGYSELYLGNAFDERAPPAHLGNLFRRGIGAATESSEDSWTGAEDVELPSLGSRRFRGASVLEFVPDNARFPGTAWFQFQDDRGAFARGNGSEVLTKWIAVHPPRSQVDALMTLWERDAQAVRAQPSAEGYRRNLYQLATILPYERGSAAIGRMFAVAWHWHLFRSRPSLPRRIDVLALTSADAARFSDALDEALSGGAPPRGPARRASFLGVFFR
jgi:hypothetical protein